MNNEEALEALDLAIMASIERMRAVRAGEVEPVEGIDYLLIEQEEECWHCKCWADGECGCECMCIEAGNG